MSAKKRGLVLLLSFLLFITPVFAQISSQDKIEIQQKVDLLSESINNGDIVTILEMTSDNSRSELKEELSKSLKRPQKFTLGIKSYEEESANQVKVYGVFSAWGVGWRIDGLRNFYIFEKTSQGWFLIDTDIHQKLNSDFILKFLGKIFLLFLPLIIILGSFWLWMLVDCLKRRFTERNNWILILCFLGIIGALFYFFIVRKIFLQRKQLEGTIYGKYF